MNRREGKTGRQSSQSGVTLIPVIFIIVILAFIGVMFVSLMGTGSFTSINDLQSTRALYVAEGGSEMARLQFENGTTCNLLTNNNIDLGNGEFTTSGQRYNPSSPVTLSAAITAAVTTVPVSADPVAAGYAPQGRIRIEDEEILYSGISGNTFTGAQRGVAGTTSAAHNTIGVPVLQDQCRIQSTGTVGNAHRSVLVDAPGYASAAVSAFLDGYSTAIGTSETNIAKLPTVLAAGTNLIVAIVSFRNTGPASSDISAGNLRLKKGAAVLASNQNLIRVGGPGGPISQTNFPQYTQYFVFRDAGASACPTYNITALASNAYTLAEVKMLVFNNAPNSSFQDGGNVLLGTSDTTFLTHATGLPAGDNVIIAAIQLDNIETTNRSISAGLLKLKRGGSTLASNQQLINLSRTDRINRSTGFMLMYRDAGAAANPTYTLTGDANAANDINAEGKMIVLNGLQSAFIDSGLINPIATFPGFSTLATLNTSFPAGDNIIITTNQYFNANSGANQRNIYAGNDRIIYNAAAQSSNQYDLNLGTANEVDDFPTGLVWHHTGSPANPSYSLQASASGTNVRGDTKMIAIHLNISSIPLFGWRENIQ